MWPNPQETSDLVTFTEEIFNGNPHFPCSMSLLDKQESSVKDYFNPLLFDVH